MKKPLFLIPALAAACLAPAARAQAPAKVAHIASRELLDALPESKLAATQLEAYVKTWQEQYNTVTARLETLQKEYQATERTLDDTARAARIAEAEALVRQQQSLQQEAGTAVDKKRQELFAPLADKVNRSIASLAAAKGYDYVIDTGNGAVIWARPGTANDLNTAVRTRLGLK